MYLYVDEIRFSPYTGKPINPVLLRSNRKFICDLTGVLFDTDEDYELMPLYTLRLSYNHDSEPIWYEEYYLFKEKFGIDYGEFSTFMESPFHFSNTEGYGCSDVSEQLMAEWVEARKNNTGRFSKCATLEQVLSTLRFEMLRKLLSEKKFTLGQLGFGADNE